MTEADASSAPTTSGDDIEITLSHHGKAIALPFAQDATISDLSERVATDLSIPSSNQKFLVGGKIGLQKPPFKNPSLPLTELVSKKITLMGSTSEAVSSLNNTITAASAPRLALMELRAALAVLPRARRVLARGRGDRHRARVPRGRLASSRCPSNASAMMPA